ncbi:hypothetical protein ANANG_G00223000 [Anguilla anguilla]|uniref:Uncharacterized protein n=1 Tax=Anguilla anguilla TaxID=7936 RepID=A0A9D3LWN2_ANGAN|nr:hypothetical protein ANANG_G00223000 [Anguilla anguilla]
MPPLSLSFQERKEDLISDGPVQGARSITGGGSMKDSAALKSSFYTLQRDQGEWDEIDEDEMSGASMIGLTTPPLPSPATCLPAHTFLQQPF